MAVSINDVIDGVYSELAALKTANSKYKKLKIHKFYVQPEEIKVPFSAIAAFVYPSSPVAVNSTALLGNRVERIFTVEVLVLSSLDYKADTNYINVLMEDIRDRLLHNNLSGVVSTIGNNVSLNYNPIESGSNIISASVIYQARKIEVL